MNSKLIAIAALLLIANSLTIGETQVTSHTASAGYISSQPLSAMHHGNTDALKLHKLSSINPNYAKESHQNLNKVTNSAHGQTFDTTSI